MIWFQQEILYLYGSMEYSLRKQDFRGQNGTIATYEAVKLFSKTDILIYWTTKP